MKKIDLARSRSIDSLQSLYAIVVSLSIAEILRSLINSINQNGFINSYNNFFIFISFTFTLVPFFHGANRYLDATYVTGERSAKHFALMIDFIAFD